MSPAVLEELESQRGEQLADHVRMARLRGHVAGGYPTRPTSGLSRLRALVTRS